MPFLNLQSNKALSSRLRGSAYYLSDVDFDAADFALRSRVSNLDASELANALAREVDLAGDLPPPGPSVVPSPRRIGRVTDIPLLDTYLTKQVGPGAISVPVLSDGVLVRVSGEHTIENDVDGNVGVQLWVSTADRSGTPFVLDLTIDSAIFEAQLADDTPFPHIATGQTITGVGFAPPSRFDFRVSKTVRSGQFLTMASLSPADSSMFVVWEIQTGVSGSERLRADVRDSVRTPAPRRPTKPAKLEQIPIVRQLRFTSTSNFPQFQRGFASGQEELQKLQRTGWKVDVNKIKSSSRGRSGGGGIGVLRFVPGAPTASELGFTPSVGRAPSRSFQIPASQLRGSAFG